MGDTRPELPTLPVVVPLALVAFAVLLWRLRRRGALTALRVTVAAIVCIYGAGVLAETFLPFPLGTSPGGYHMGWRVWLHLTPLVDTDPAGLILNVLLFLPLGVLVPLASGRWSIWRTLLIGVGLSLSIETVQFLADVTISSGRVADVDDLLANVGGTLASAVLFRLALWVPPVRRLAAAAAIGRVDSVGREPVDQGALPSSSSQRSS